jgi:hypothetical protein
MLSNNHLGACIKIFIFAAKLRVFGSNFLYPFLKRIFMLPIPKEPKLRWSHLNHKEVERLWNAMSFHMWQYGGVMTVHVVILWKTLAVTDHTQARHLLGQYLNRCQKWGESASQRLWTTDHDGNGPCGSPDTVTASFSDMSLRTNAAETRAFTVMF